MPPAVRQPMFEGTFSITRTLLRAVGGMALALGLIFVPLSPAFSGQIIIIDTNLGATDVYGNGSPPNGSGPPTADTATDNAVNVLSGGAVGGNVYGGYAESYSGAATATGNSAAISGGTVSGSVYGGEAASYSGAATATGNSVTVGGGTVNGDIYGGYTHSDLGAATATGNSVTISGGAVNGGIYGGYSLVDGWGETGSATDNTVTISGTPTFAAAASLYGGFVGNAGTPEPGTDAFSGNTLNVWNYSGSAVASVRNFQYLNFVFPITQATPALTASYAGLGDGAGRSSTVTASTLGGTDPLRPGFKVILIDTGGGTLDIADFTQTRAQGLHGATLQYNWTLDTAGGMLTAGLDGVQASPRSKALSAGFLSGLALANQGADLAAGRGMAQAMSAAGPKGASAFGTFAALSGGWSRYNTGSHVDMSSVNLIAGFARGMDLSPGRLTLGAFFEYGNGSYDTRNSFSNAASVHGDGDISHLGGGILGRMDFIHTGPGHFYAETSGRAGGAHNEYSTSDIRDATGRSVKGYDSESAYYGLHLGTGYVWNITDAASLDLHAKYFWTRQEGDSVRLSTGDPVKFRDADSYRLRLGGRFAYAVNEYVSPYAGAAYEHEFDGRARAATYGYDIDSPKLTGGTGVGEIGLSLKPSQTLPLSFDLGIQGYAGKREGVTGSLQSKFEF